MTTKAPMTEESKPVTKMPVGKETILVVEDEDAVRSLIKDILERVGYRVMATGNPDAAESLFEKHQDEIELLVSDVVMPGKSGPELYRRLSQQKSGLYVLFISGYTESGVFDRSELNEHSSFIQKPFRPTELVQRVREILDR